MSVEVIMGAASFVGLFFAWVVLPSQIQKRHDGKDVKAPPAEPGIES
ncbi:MAG: hypothetical protein HYX91_02380 [Chloroflexi bacterium]|nr:hypothetical protein [Chloroflexota bacterium]